MIEKLFRKSEIRNIFRDSQEQRMKRCKLDKMI